MKSINLDNTQIISFATHGLVSGEINGSIEPALVLTPPKTVTAIDDGLLIISGKLNDNISFEKLDKAIWEEINLLLSHNLSKNDLNRIMNKIRTSKEFENMGILNQAMNLCYYELLGDADMINKESNIYDQIKVNDINRVAKSILKKSSCSLLKVKARKNDR